MNSEDVVFLLLLALVVVAALAGCGGGDSAQGQDPDERSMAVVPVINPQVRQ